MSIDLWDLWKDVSSFDPELPTGLSHILGHLGPELSLVQSPNAPRTAWTRNQKVSGKLGLIAPLLDSLISLLPYKPQAQFAGTLALSKKSARLCVSADDDSQLDLALQNTTAIEKCWTLVQDSINDVDSGVPSSIELICKCTLVRSFITHHLGSGRQYSRFQKRSRECAACFAYLRTCNLPCVSGAIERSYLDISEKVFHLYEQAFASDVWTDQDLVQLCEYANAIKCLEEQNPTRNTRAFVSSASRWFQHGSILESVLPLPLNALPRRWDFDAVRYIDKLIRPALQAIELYRLSKRSTFRKMFKGRSLHIVGVRATDYGTRHPPSIGIDAIHRLVHEIPGHPKDQETLIGQINSAFPDTYPDANIAFKSHPECLIRYPEHRGMLIAIIGTRCSGKSTIKEYLVSSKGFVSISIAVSSTVNGSSVKSSSTQSTERLFNRDRSTDVAAKHLSFLSMDTTPLPSPTPYSVRPSSSSPENTSSLSFSSPEDAFEHITIHWRTNFVTTDLATRDLAETFLRRPFFMLLSVDAPLFSRFQRCDESCSLEAFVREDDAIRFGIPRLRKASPMTEMSDLVNISIMNDHATISELHQYLENLDLPNPAHLRPDWDTYFMTLASLASHRSNCMKRRVGAILVRDKRIVSTGYNGTPRHLKNCNEGGCPHCNGTSRAKDASLECLCLHAEENALLEAGRERVGEGSVLYCNTCPCLKCTVKIIQTGVRSVVYNLAYKMDDSSARLFEEAGVELRRFDPNVKRHLPALDGRLR
ncbi:Deoxycytidine monophosphate (dCMP) deaminase [Paramarasmius palmivorus]|uniref:Deoxycytidylate deaminase n=1 Tax=Paramarasmius palmivorus TaxID=297713 RepID=A0AAW0E065_9AGAR